MSMMVRLQDGSYVNGSLIKRVRVISTENSAYVKIVFGIARFDELNFPFDTLREAQDEADRIAREANGEGPLSDHEGFFDGLDGISFALKLEELSARCAKSSDPFVRWVGTRLFHRHYDRAVYLGATSPEDFEDKDEAALEQARVDATNRIRLDRDLERL